MRGPLYEFKQHDGTNVYMTLASAHDARIIGCLRYQWLLLLERIDDFVTMLARSIN